MITITAGLITCLLTTLVSPLPPTSDSSTLATPVTVHLNPDGTDTNDGLTPSTPVKTLNRVEEVLANLNPTTDVEVRIEQGVYVAGRTFWQFYIPGHTITFMPEDYEYGEGISGIAGRPVFRNDGTGANWLHANLPTGHPGGDTQLRFYYLQIEDYVESAITINGGYDTVDGMRVPTGAGANRNTFMGLALYNIGTKHQTLDDRYGYAGLVLSNSHDNSIRNSHFRYLENVSPYTDHIHGVYITNGSLRNSVRGNTFAWISGDPIRVRNDSQDTNIHSNSFTRTGANAYYGEWFCDTSCATSLNHPRECASHGNVFHDNNIVSAYQSGINLVSLVPPGSTYAGGAGCSNDAEPRVTTYNNT